MENTSGFYKNDDGYVLFGPNFVINANYHLTKENKDDHTYPVDGWYWFDTAEEAYGFFGIPYDQEENSGE